MTLGMLVKEYRHSHGMNMQDFAKRCGLSKAYISILERNHNPASGKPPIPSMETIMVISNVIGRDFNEVISLLDRDQLISLRPEPSALKHLSTSPPEPSLSDEARAIAQAYEMATPKEQQTVRLVLSDYLEKLQSSAPSKTKKNKPTVSLHKKTPLAARQYPGQAIDLKELPALDEEAVEDQESETDY